MANKMIIDASHPEETRVVVLRGNRVEEFDFESASKRPLRGNIYLAKVTRVEPSLQAAFIDYGGNRHGFLAFSEIHPDYYQIPVADRQVLLEEEAQSQREEDEEAGGERRSRRHRYPRRRGVETRAEEGETLSEPVTMEESGAERFGKKPSTSLQGESADTEAVVYEPLPVAVSRGLNSTLIISAETGDPVKDLAADLRPESTETPPLNPGGAAVFDESVLIPTPSDEHIAAAEFRRDAEREERSAAEKTPMKVTTLDGGSEERVASDKHRTEEEGELVEQIGGDALEEMPRRPQRVRRQYKIQEVIKRRQVFTRAGCQRRTWQQGRSAYHLPFASWARYFLF